jgi:hypothetical protein
MSQLPRLASVSHRFYNEILWLIGHTSIVPLIPILKEVGARNQEMVPFKPETSTLTLRIENKDMHIQYILLCYLQLSPQLQESIRYLTIECKTEEEAQWLVSLEMTCGLLTSLMGCLVIPFLKALNVRSVGRSVPWLEGTVRRGGRHLGVQWV